MCHSACSTFLKLSSASSTLRPYLLSIFARWMLFSASMYTPTSVCSCFFTCPQLNPQALLSSTTFAVSEREVGLKYSPKCPYRSLKFFNILVRVLVLRLPQQPLKLNISPYCKSQQTSSNGASDSKLLLDIAVPFGALTLLGIMLFPFTLKTPSPLLLKMASLTNYTEFCHGMFLCLRLNSPCYDFAMFSYIATQVADSSYILRTMPLRPSTVSIYRMYCNYC